MTLQNCVEEIKRQIGQAIQTGGATQKNSLINSQGFINPLCQLDNSNFQIID